MSSWTIGLRDRRSRAQFFALASRATRNVRVDHARARKRVNRDGGAARITRDEARVVASEPDPRLLDLDAVRTELAAQDGRKARAVELHFFGGLTFEEIAKALAVSLSTAGGDARLAKAWLTARLEEEDPHHGARS